MSEGEDRKQALAHIQDVLRRLQSLSAETDEKPADGHEPIGHGAREGNSRASSQGPVNHSETVASPATDGVHAAEPTGASAKPSQSHGEIRYRGGVDDDQTQASADRHSRSGPRYNRAARLVGLTTICVGSLLAGGLVGLKLLPEILDVSNFKASAMVMAAPEPSIKSPAAVRRIAARVEKADETADLRRDDAANAPGAKAHANGVESEGSTTPLQPTRPVPADSAEQPSGARSEAATVATASATSTMDDAPPVGVTSTNPPSAALPPPPPGPLLAPPTPAVRPQLPTKSAAGNQVTESSVQSSQPTVPADQPTGMVLPPGGSTPAQQQVASTRFGRQCADADISVEAIDGGMMGLAVKSRCRAGQSFDIVYDAVTRSARFDQTGTADLQLDLFLGLGKSIVLAFEDGVKRIVSAKSNDLDRMIKVALVWKAPINLDLHALEFGAAFGSAGHIWEKAPSSYAEAVRLATKDGRGHGFMSSSADATTPGTHIEVYTFVRPSEHTAVSVVMALDYETRGSHPSGETCGAGRFSTVDYDLYVLGPHGQTTSAKGTINPLDCNVELGPEKRYQQAALPTLRFEAE